MPKRTEWTKVKNRVLSHGNLQSKTLLSGDGDRQTHTATHQHPPTAVAKDLLDLFESTLGPDTVFAVEISTDRNNWKSRGFGRVQFATLEAKSQALLLSHRDRLVFKSHSLKLSRTYDDIIPRLIRADYRLDDDLLHVGFMTNDDCSCFGAMGECERLD
ncbi:RNA-dependent RNA polymerase 2-like, partial [Hibiscus syriacus]|uniref:RNA-dependent RNA polymerase 2-like n=1 Tax=Hibiscus syriacus TaxID=106335 RepID=UPI0019237594